MEHYERTGERLRILLDGEDVTHRCYRVAFHEDRVTADLWLFKVDAQGRKYLDEDRQVAKEMKTGQPVIAPEPHVAVGGGAGDSSS
jgi:hypothetical protein